MNNNASIVLDSREILTYPFSDPNPVPVLTEGLGAIYPFVTEGRGEIYPYHSFSGYTNRGQLQKWDVIKLENDFIEVYVLPEIGGKVWGAIEKSTGKEFIYRNGVVKFRNVSQRGPWTSGGIEFNFGFIGHHPSTCVPVDYKTAENADGSVSCIVGSMDLPSRTNWKVEIRLPKDKAYFETRVMWNNPTPIPQSYYNWMTAAAVVSDDLEFIYPGYQELGHDGAAGPWPVDRAGRDLSWYANNAFGSDRSSHVVGQYSKFMGGYYHKTEFGFGHWALYDDMPGHKLWLWSQARSSAIWEDLLTDSNGQYLEFQAGRQLSQYSPSPVLKSPITQVPFAPGLTDRWNEIWFPVKTIGGFVDVSPAGVLNVSDINGKLHIGINALAYTQAKVTARSREKVIFTETRDFKPMDVFQASVPLNSGEPIKVTVNGMDLCYTSIPKKRLERPFVSVMPTDISTAASLYQQGTELKEARNYRAAKEFYEKCLEEDPLFIEAYVALTELYYRSSLYDQALYHVNKALQLDTYHPAANYYAGITYYVMGDLINAMETLGWAARSMEFRSTAYAQMAGIELQLGNSEYAEHYANQSLDYNRYNFNALRVLAIVYRTSGKTALADRNIETINQIDPLDHFADFERYLLHPSDENLTLFIAAIRNEMPYQTCIELCLIYYGLGLKNDALMVLEKTPESHPLIKLWLAYLKNDPSLLDEVARESPAYVFPYRTETARALEWALTKNPSWKFKYYLALNYWAIQREEEAGQLFLACGQEPDYAPFYLTRASLVNSKEEKKELMDLDTARKFAPEDWRTLNKLIKFHEKYGNYKSALILSSAAHDQFRGNTTLDLQYATILLNIEQYDTCIELLEKMQIIPGEGLKQGKAVHEQAYLLKALDLIKNNNYPEALVQLEKAREWPENLGVGMPYEPDDRIEDYLSAYCMRKLSRDKEARTFQDAVVNFTLKHFSEPSFNNILALMIYKEKGEMEAANLLIQKINNSPNTDNPFQRWITAVYKNDIGLIDQLENDINKSLYAAIIKKIVSLKRFK